MQIVVQLIFLVNNMSVAERQEHQIGNQETTVLVPVPQ